MDKNNPAEIFSRPNDQAQIFDFEQFTFWADAPHRKGFRCRLVFGERNGAPRISYFPNTGERGDMVWAGFDPLTFWEFLDRFEAVIKGPKGGKDHIDNNGRTRADPESGTPGEFFVRCQLHFGKDDEGVVWLGMSDKKAPNCRFKILAPAWHHFFKPDGTRISIEEGSLAYASHLVDLLRRIYPTFIGRLRPPFAGKGAKSNVSYGDDGDKPKSKSTESFESSVEFAGGTSSDGDEDIPY